MTRRNIMKKISVIGAALLALAACSRENVNTEPVGKEITLFASMPDTKAKVDDSGIFTWQEGDRIGVYVDGSSSPVPFTLTSGAGESIATFTGTVSGTLAGYAVYPYNSETTLSGTTLSVKLPNTADYNNQKVILTMLAKDVAEGSPITFTHLGGLVKVAYKEVPSNAAMFRFTTNKADKSVSGDRITGTATVDVSAAVPVLSAATGSSSENYNYTVNIPDANIAKGNMNFYVPLAPGSYPFHVSLRTSSYSVLSRTERARTSTYDIAAGELYLLPEITVPGIFTFENSTELSYYKLSGNAGALSVVANPAKDAVNPSATVLKDDMHSSGSTSGYFQFSSPWASGAGTTVTIKMYMGENEYYPYLQIGGDKQLPVKIDGVAVASESDCEAQLWGEGVNKWHLLEYSSDSFSALTQFHNALNYQFRPFSIAGGASAPAESSPTNTKIAYFDDFEMKQN